MTKILNLQGKETKEVKLPKVFSTPVRLDLIKRAVLAIQSAKRQPYGHDPLAGQRTSAHYHGVREGPHHMMNAEMSRIPRTHGTSGQQEMRARFAPHAVTGRPARGPKAEKIWKQKINKKEAKLATATAIAATLIPELVKKRGHDFTGALPLVLEDKLQEVKKTKDLENVLKALKLDSELKRAVSKKVRAGKGKMRGRKYKRKTSILFVIAKEDGIEKAASNFSGFDVCLAKNLNSELLAPGTQAGRLVIWSESAINELEKIFG